MNLLKAAFYDPTGAVAKSTASLLAMTAFDTTNLRLAFTIPAHGMVRVRMQTTLSGATTMPQVLLGVLEGSTVRGRQVPLAALPGTALATTNVPLVADYILTGLTPGAVSWDAAYGVEVVVASTNINYGGPNDTTTNNAWGGFAFEVYDPQPQTTTGQLSVDANGRVDAIKIAGTTQTAIDLGAVADLTLTIPDSIPADGTRPSVRSALLMISRFLWEHSNSGTTGTIKKEDGSTTAFAVTYDSSTNPTSVTRTS